MDPPPPVPIPAPPARSPERLALTVGVVVLLGLLLYRGYGSSYRVDPSRQSSPALPLDVNAADRTELLQVPGVGPTMADAILSHRTTFGPFQSLDELDSVRGIGGKTLVKLRPWLTVEAKTEAKPVAPQVEKLERKLAAPPAVPAQSTKLAAGQQIDINTASVAELQGLPGIGPKLAERIVEARNQKPFASIEDLRRVGGIGAKTLEKLRPHLTFGK